MKAVVQESFGPPESLRCTDVDVLAPGPGEVLVRVHAASLNPYDWHLLRGDPWIARLIGGVGLRRPRARIAGIDVAGRVDSVGVGVTALRPGDDVLGFAPEGSFAEYAVAPADLLVVKPPGLGFDEAAALPMAGTTAWRGICEVAAVRSGQRVLINGAAGGIGTFAVQLAASLGAEVTGVCSTRNLDLVRSLGAAHVIDHTVSDFTGTGCYEAILDNVGNRPPGRVRRVLAPTGTLVHNAGGPPGKVFGAMGAFVRIMVLNAVVRQQLLPLPTRLDRRELEAITDLVVAGTIHPVVDRSYRLTEVAAGLRHLETGHARGKAVVIVA